MSGSKPKKPAPSAQERALAEVAAKKYNDFVTRYIPLAKQLRGQIQPGADVRRDMKTDAVLGASQGLMSALQARGAVAGAAARGVMPGAGSVALGLAGAMNRGAAASGLAVGRGEQMLRNRETRGLLRLAALGRGLQDQASLGLADAGRRATEQEILREQLRAERAQMVGEAIGQGLGMYAAFKKN